MSLLVLGASHRSAPIQVGPTVAALHATARDVVDAEVVRLRARLPAGTDARVAAEIELAVHRVAEELLHTPTVQVTGLVAGSEDGASWVAVLRQLFDLGGSPAGAAV